MLIEKWELVDKKNLLDTDWRLFWKIADGRRISGLNMMDYEGSHVCKIYKDVSLVSIVSLKCMATHSFLPFVRELFTHWSYIVFIYFYLQASSLQNYLQLSYFKSIC